MSRPYFETQVVKFGKPKIKKEGNWVNGENLDKIKFPCFCSYDSSGVRKYGLINKDFKEGFTAYSYKLVRICEQSTSVNAVWDYDSLAELIRVKTIHILKGKIIIFEGED
jgi:hypothetical protein